jgi:secreted Zn-dependent insulinase-like peptidase
LIDPQNALIVLTSSTLEDEEFNRIEPRYEIPYGVYAISDELQEKLVHPTLVESELTLGLPLPNAFMPDNFEILPPDEAYST